MIASGCGHANNSALAPSERTRARGVVGTRTIRARWWR
jgi:hypothetical protein